MMLLKCCTQYVSKFGKLSSDHRTGKCQFLFQSQARAMPKYVQTTLQLSSFHMLARICSKSFKLGYRSVWIKNFQMYKLVVKRQRNQRWNCQHLFNHGESKGVADNICFCFIDCYIMLKPLTVWLTKNCRKFLKRWEYQTPLPAS